MAWCNEPTQRELLDVHLANIATILINSNSKKKVKPEELMLLYSENDKKATLQAELKMAFAKFGDKVKIDEKK